MKKQLGVLLFCMMLLICPTKAQTTGTITLNGLYYTSLNPTYIKDEVLYLSAEDLVQLTYGSLTKGDDHYTLRIQNESILFSPDARVLKINGTTTIVTHAPELIDHKIYLPINILGYISYPYKINTKGNVWTIESLPPYSKTTDSYDTHKLMPSSVNNLSVKLESLLDAKQSESLLALAIKDNYYISFIDNTLKSSLLQSMHEEIRENKPRRVAFRNIDLLSPSHEVSDLTILPLTLKTDKDALQVKVGTETIISNCLWTTYLPSKQQSLLSFEPNTLDVTKTLDTTLMRILYEYYRDQTDLKDDLFSSPLIMTKMGRSDSITQNVYWDNEAHHRPVYNVTVYKHIDDTFITYYIDLSLKN